MTQIEKLSAAIAGLESQRKGLGDAVVDPAIAALREQLAQTRDAGGDARIADERKLVTIVFTDVSGFTALSEKLRSRKSSGLDQRLLRLAGASGAEIRRDYRQVHWR